MAAARPKLDEQLATQLEALQCCFVLADCQEPDHPITYASSGFYDLTGYSPNQVLGKNCRFLQGPETSRQKIMEMRDAIREERTCEVCLINYKRSGDKFWNQFYLAPVLDENSCVSHYMGIQSDVSHLMAQDGSSQTADKVNDQDSLEAHDSCHQVQFPDVVQVEQQKAEGVNHVLTTWSSSQGRHSGDLLRWSTGPGGVPAQDLPSSLLAPLMRLQKSFVLSDPKQPDCPIVHASTAFLLMTGYPREAVIGRNCRFLQGPQTDKAEVKRMRDAIAADPPRPVTVKLLNYRLDGQPFWNNLHVAPIRNSCGQVMFFVGVQLDITAPPTKRSEVQQSAQSRFGPADSSASRHGINAASQAVDAPHEAQHSDAIVSPAAHQQVQSQVMPHADSGPDPPQNGLSEQRHTQSAFPHTGQPPMQTASGAADSTQQPVGQSHGPRQLLSRSSAPAGSQAAAAAARAALLPDGFQQRLHVQPGQRVAGIPECGQATIQNRMDQKGVVGAVRVACRSLSSCGLRRSLEDQASPRHLFMAQRAGDTSQRRSLHMRQTF